MKPQTKPALKTPPESFTPLPFWLRRAVQSQSLEWFHHDLLYHPSAQDQLCRSVWGREGHSPPLAAPPPPAELLVLLSAETFQGSVTLLSLFA